MSFRERAERTLKDHIAEIQTVNQWAVHMGYESVEYFSRKIRNVYGRRPKEILIDVKLQCIEDRLRKSGDEILYCIAREVGFDHDTAMYKFIKRHTGKTPSQLKRESEE
jgi:AraC-like DNA-binding protein